MNPRRTLGLTLGLLLALVGARWIASDDSGARGAPTPMLPTPGLTPGRVEPDGYAPGLGAPDAPDSGRSAIESAALPAAGEQAAAGQAAGVPFRVHVLDDQGRMHERESGRLRVVLWEGGAGSFLEVQVHEGVFTLEAAPAGGVKADSGTLGGRGVLPEPAARGGTGQPGQEPRGGAGSPLVLRWAPLALLRVVDAVSGRDLPEVEVYARGGLDHGLGAHPGLVPAERLVTGPSPISLEVSDFELSGTGGVVYAHARGHAWGQARVALARGGETTLRLQPGGDLEVGLVGAELPPLAYLRLRADLDGRVLAEVTLAGARRPVLLTGLPLGSLLASVEVGDRTAEPELLGRAQAEITPGLTRVEVVIEPRVPAALAALAGVVVLPSAWELGERKLRLQRIGGSLWDPEDAFELPLDRPRAGSEDEYPFDAGRVRTGRWLLELEELRTSLAVDVPAQGCRNARLVIGPPAELLSPAPGLPLLAGAPPGALGRNLPQARAFRRGAPGLRRARSGGRGGPLDRARGLREPDGREGHGARRAGLERAPARAATLPGDPAHRP